MKARQNKLNIVTVVLVVLVAEVIRLANNMDLITAAPLTDFIRVMLHTGLFTVWGFALWRRVVQTQARFYLCGIAVLMVLWLNFRTIKYDFITDLNAARYLWYLYYLPLVYIPLFLLFAALFLGKADSYRLPWWAHLLHVPAAGLFVMVVTNDLHQLVFRFPADAVIFTDKCYRRGIGYGLVFGWFALCILAAFRLMVPHLQANRKRREFLPLVLSLGMTALYVLTYGLPFTKFLAGDMSAVCCLLFAAILESCIHCGLIPTNTRYDEMFAACTGSSARIVDDQYRVCCASGEAEMIPAEKMREAEKEPVLLSPEKILHNTPISGGHVIWTEDISQSVRLRRQLTELQEELAERNAILQYEYTLEKERKTVEEQNRLYDLLTASTQKQIDRISELMKNYEQAAGDAGKESAILSHIAVLGSYVKRKKHLVLSVYSGYDIGQEELKNAFAESARYLRHMKVACAVLVDTGKPYLPGNAATLAYDFFEAAVEAALHSLAGVMVTVSTVKGSLRIRLVVRCGQDLRALSRDYPQAEILASDENEWTLVLPLEGGTRE